MATRSLALLCAVLSLIAVACAADAAPDAAAAAPPAPESAAPPANATAPDAAPQKPVVLGKTDGFYPPEIESAQVAGLFVGLIFLLIFIPGFMCLYSIQTPQTFAMLDSAEMKKKLQ